jgi:hypothetical protein
MFMPWQEVIAGLTTQRYCTTRTPGKCVPFWTATATSHVLLVAVAIVDPRWLIAITILSRKINSRYGEFRMKTFTSSHFFVKDCTPPPCGPNLYCAPRAALVSRTAVLEKDNSMENKTDSTSFDLLKSPHRLPVISQASEKLPPAPTRYFSLAALRMEATWTIGCKPKASWPRELRVQQKRVPQMATPHRRKTWKR